MYNNNEISYLLTACSELIVIVKIEWLLLEYSFILCVPMDLFLIPIKIAIIVNSIPQL